MDSWEGRPRSPNTVHYDMECQEGRSECNAIYREMLALQNEGWRGSHLLQDIVLGWVCYDVGRRVLGNGLIFTS